MGIVERRVARAVLLTPAHRILLIRAQEPALGGELWLTPGGGIEPHEEPRDALRREVREETGLDGCEPGPCVWTRTHTFDWDGRRFRQRERFYLVWTEPFEPSMAGNPESIEVDAFREFRWWSRDEIRRSGDLFVPRRLGEHLSTLLDAGPPSAPVDVGV